MIRIQAGGHVVEVDTDAEARGPRQHMETASRALAAVRLEVGRVAVALESLGFLVEASTVRDAGKLLTDAILSVEESGIHPAGV